MKRVIFLIVGILMVLGLVLPGCGTTPPPSANVIKIAVVGPMTDLQGINMWNGATMAADELNEQNSGNGPAVNGTDYQIQLVRVETHETSSSNGNGGADGTAALLNVINSTNVCVGGFRTEAVSVYRDVAMNAHKVFIDVGAATNSLCYSVNNDTATYKYWFRGSPYNDMFLVTSCLKMTATVGGYLHGALETVYGMNTSYVKPAYQSEAAGGELRVEILMEDAAWCEGMVTAAQTYLPELGFNVTGTTLVSPTATDLTSELTAIEGRNPDIIFTAFSGSVGAVYSIQKSGMGIPAMTIGINVPGQQLSQWSNTGGKCEGEVMLDTYAWNLTNNAAATPANTAAWFDQYQSEFGIYPVYTAATYDAIKTLVAGMQDISSTTDSDALVTWLQDPANIVSTGVGSPKEGYYPVAADDLGAVPSFLQTYEGIGEIYGLTQPQVESIYDLASYGWTYNESEWGVTPSGVGVGFGTPINGAFDANDLIYGPGYSTGIGSQWQVVNGTGKKVGIWPKQVVPGPANITLLKAMALIDQYGNWNFQYPGTMKIILPIAGMLYIPWDAYLHAQ